MDVNAPHILESDDAKRHVDGYLICRHWKQTALTAFMASV